MKFRKCGHAISQSSFDHLYFTICQRGAIALRGLVQFADDLKPAPLPRMAVGNTSPATGLVLRLCSASEALRAAAETLPIRV
jgi:hypothetical protein